MREFQGRSSSLSRLSPGAKLLYGGYVLLTLAGFLSSVALYWDSLGLDPARYFLGNAADADAVELILEKSPRQLLETTHFHLFTVPVCLLILGHLFLLSRGGSWKVAVIALALVFTSLHVAGPWLIHLGFPGWIMPVTGIPFLFLYLLMALWPLWDLRSSSSS